MRHIQLKPIQISSWLKVLQQKEKNTTGRSPTDAHVSISHLQRIPWPAA
jgi:hypothetical protein